MWLLELWRMATASLDDLRVRAERIVGTVPDAKVVDSEAVAGGGSLPGFTIPSIAVAVEVDDANRVLTALHRRDVVARIADRSIVADLRTVDAADDAALTEALRDAVASPAPPA